jgi:hypothetical protein
VVTKFTDFWLAPSMPRALPETSCVKAARP